MWKKAKRILSCILALVLLLSMANGQRIFVQADSEAVIKTQVEDKAGGKEVSGNKEISSSAKTTEKKQETTTEKSTEKPAEKLTETTTESGKEDEKSDKPNKSDENNGKDSEDKDTKKEETTENQDTKKEDKNSEEKSEDKAEETTDTAEETATEQQEDTAEEIGATQEEAPEATTMQEEEQTTEAVAIAEEKTGGMKEYIPQEQPAEISVKAYAKDGVFPEGTSMKVRKINEKEKAQAESTLKNEVEYDGFLGYDISFYDKDGKGIEPEEGNVKVSLQLKESALSKEADKTTLTIQHFDDSKKKLNVEQVASAASGTMEVQSGKVSAEYSVDSFSVFTITWKNNSSAVASLTATCIDTAGQQVTIQYDGGKATGTINESSITYDANKEDITDVSDVSTLAPTVQRATFVKAVIATSQNTANQSGTEIRYLRLDSGAWQYSLDKSEWNNIGNNNLYYIYSKNSVSDSVNSISFAYYGLDEINDMHSIAARDTVKFTISLVDENGNNETYKLPQGSVIPDKYTFHSSSVDMNAASFAQMGIIVPGYTYEGGYAYFYWNGNFAGKKFSVSNFKNLGANSTKYGNSYDSYIGYTGTHPDGAHAGNDDYSKATFGDRGYNYYAYNPTGTLRIVFKKVSSTVAYKSNFVDAYKNDTYRLIDEKAMEMHQIGSSTDYYGTLKTVTATVPEREGYTFEGWYMEKDADGNGTGTRITNPEDDKTEYKRDAYYYAKWVPKTCSLSVKKIVDTSGENNMGDKNESFTFTLTLKKENTPYEENITGLTKTNTKGQYTFSLKDGETMKADLPYKYEYTITEDAKDYTVTITAPSGVSKDTDKKLVSGTVDSNKEITFTNKKTIVPPTGISTTMTAWFLMTGATLILGAVFFLFGVRRKRLMA